MPGMNGKWNPSCLIGSHRIGLEPIRLACVNCAAIRRWCESTIRRWCELCRNPTSFACMRICQSAEHDTETRHGITREMFALFSRRITERPDSCQSTMEEEVVVPQKGLSRCGSRCSRDPATATSSLFKLIPAEQYLSYFGSTNHRG